MAQTISYEIQSMKDGNWTIVTVTENKADAMSQARQLMRSRHQKAIKVIEEKYDDETAETISTVVFKEEKGEEKFKPKRAVKKDKAIDAPTPAKPKAKAKTKTDFVRNIVLLVLSLGGIALAILLLGFFIV